MPEWYWTELQRRYDRWIGGFGLSPVSELDARSYDVLHPPRAPEGSGYADGIDLQVLDAIAASA